MLSAENPQEPGETTGDQGMNRDSPAKVSAGATQHAPMQGIGRPWWRVALLAALCFVPTALLWSFRDAAFVSDDRWFATVPLVDAAGHWLIAPWPHPFGPAQAYRPFVVLTYALTLWYSSGTPLVFHLTNFLIHGINAALLAALLWRVSGSWLAALLAGLMFAVHPITHENVVWISGRTYPLAVMFSLALLWWTSTSTDRGWTRWRQHAIGSALLLGALMSYEMAVTLPIMVAAIQFCVDSEPGDTTPRRWGRAMQFAAPYFGVLAAYLVFRWVAISSFSGDSMVWRHGINPDPLMKNVRLRVLANASTLGVRLLNADDALFGPLTSLRTATTLASVALVGVAVWGVLRSRDVRRLAAGALVLAGVAFAPAVVGPGFVDRLTYLTVAGAVSFVALGVSTAFRLAWNTGRIALTMCLLIVLSCWGARYQMLGAEWRHAGMIADSLLHQLVTLDPTPAPHAELHFTNVPLRFGVAYVYVTYFHHSVRHQYGRDDLEIVTHSDEPAAAILAKLRDANDVDVNGSGDGTPHETALFDWDPSTERLSLLWRRPTSPSEPRSARVWSLRDDAERSGPWARLHGPPWADGRRPPIALQRRRIDDNGRR